MGVNKIFLMGRITKDVELTYAKSNQDIAIAKYSIAVDEYQGKDKEKKTQFFNITAFGKAGEFAHNYFKKGKRVFVEGKVQFGEYENKDGIKVKTFEVIATSQEFADGKGETTTEETKNLLASDIPDSIDNIDDDLPFN